MNIVQFSHKASSSTKPELHIGQSATNPAVFKPPTPPPPNEKASLPAIIEQIHGYNQFFPPFRPEIPPVSQNGSPGYAPPRQALILQNDLSTRPHHFNRRPGMQLSGPPILRSIFRSAILLRGRIRVCFHFIVHFVIRQVLHRLIRQRCVFA